MQPATPQPAPTATAPKPNATAASILDLIQCRGGKINSNDPSLQAWRRRTRYNAVRQLMDLGLVVARRSLHDARVLVYEVVA